MLSGLHGSIPNIKAIYLTLKSGARVFHQGFVARYCAGVGTDRKLTEYPDGES
jgi:hypothetical protein